MTAPSTANAITQWKDVVNILDAIETGGATVVTRFNTLLAVAIYDYSTGVSGAATALRGVLASAIEAGAVQGAQAAALSDFMNAILAPEAAGADFATMIYRAREWRASQLRK